MFKKAIPIWLKNKSKVVNFQAGFRFDFQCKKENKYVLKISGASLYRIFLNGKFVSYGPARAAHGFFRCDTIKLSIKEGLNRLAIEVAGYNCSDFYTLNTRSFICAEVKENESIIGFTGNNFKGISLEELRERKVFRYTFQRTFSEVWNCDLSTPLYNWTLTDSLNYAEITKIDLTEEFIEREMKTPDFNIINIDKPIERGILEKNDIEIYNKISNTRTSCIMTGYYIDMIKDKPGEEINGVYVARDNTDTDLHILSDCEYMYYSLKNNSSGFIKTDLKALTDCTVYVVFDEKLDEKGKIQYNHLHDGINVVKYNLKKADELYELETFECYTCKYIGIVVLNGEAEIKKVSMREYCYPDTDMITFKCSDDKINEIYDAAVNTYRQNTIDVFMDCPQRERAGWLCDSYFTSQCEQYFTGNTTVERCFLNNYVQAKEFPAIDVGMIPMCYPAEHMDEQYIPQWAMWYIIELDSYLKRSNDMNVERFKNLVYDLIKFFEKYVNQDGLLESLPKWNLIEWSDARFWMDGVHYPTNMLYSKVLEIVGRLYSDDKLKRRAIAVKNAVLTQSFNGYYFCDHAVRDENGKLNVMPQKSEVCQYFALFFGIADTSDKFKKLTDLVLNIFGPERKRKNIMPEFAYANSFIGNYLRLEILLTMKKYRQILDESKEYYYYMAKKTGTLWEHDSSFASCNHGFASFAGIAVLRCVTGIKEINFAEKKIIFDSDPTIKYECRIKTDDGEMILNNEQHSIPFGWTEVDERI